MILNKIVIIYFNIFIKLKSNFKLKLKILK